MSLLVLGHQANRHNFRSSQAAPRNHLPNFKTPTLLVTTAYEKKQIGINLGPPQNAAFILHMHLQATQRTSTFKIPSVDSLADWRIRQIRSYGKRQVFSMMTKTNSDYMMLMVMKN